MIRARNIISFTQRLVCLSFGDVVLASAPLPCSEGRLASTVNVTTNRSKEVDYLKKVNHVDVYGTNDTCN
jgi:hypothetical protein